MGKHARRIADAKMIAEELAKSGDGTTHSRAVCQEMIARGMLDGYEGTQHFLGQVFRDKKWVKTGDKVKAKSEKINARDLPVWRLRQPHDIEAPPCKRCGGTGFEP